MLRLTMNLQHLANMILLAIPVSAISITISKGLIFERARTWMLGQNKWIGNLVRCPYCTSHWVALLAVAVSLHEFDGISNYRLVSIILATMGVVAIATPMSWIIYRSYMFLEPGMPSAPQSDEVEKLRNILIAARSKLAEQAQEIEQLRNRTQ